MSTQVRWTKLILETFLVESGIHERVENGDQHAIELEMIMRTRFNGWDRQAQATELCMDIRTVDSRIRELKDLYDETQKHSIILPVRKKSKKELELDRRF